MSIRKHRLSIVIFLVIFPSYMLVGALWLTPTLIQDRARGFAELALRTETGLKTAQMRQKAETIAETVALLRIVIAVTPVAGAIVLDPRGRGLRKIGDELPGNSDRLRRRLLINVRAFEGRFMDLYLNTSRTGLPYNVIVRINTGAFRAGLASHLKRLTGFGFLILLFGGAVSVIVLYRVIVLPLGLLRRALAENLGTNSALKLPPTMLTRKDVIGDLARMLEPRGRSGLPAAHVRESPVLIDDIPFEILSFDAGGALTEANGRALELFHCRTLAELQSVDLGVIQADGEPEGDPCSLPDLFCDRRHSADGLVVGGPEPVPRRIITRSAGDDQGKSANLVICLLAPEVLAPEVLAQTIGANAPRVSLQLATLERRTVKLKLLLEGCLTLLAKPDTKTITAGSQPVRTDMLVEDWYLDASRCGLIDSQMEHDVPGQVVGDPETVTNLIRHALTFVALRSETEKPVLAGSGKMRGGDMVEFVFEEVTGLSPADQKNDESESHQLEDSKLPLAALTKLLAAYGGRVLAIRGQDDGNLIRFIMPARPAREQHDAADMSVADAKTAA